MENFFIPVHATSIALAVVEFWVNVTSVIIDYDIDDRY